MISQVSKRSTVFYQVSLVVIMLTTLSTILYFWKLGFMDGSRSKDLHQASFILDSVEKKKPINEVASLIYEERAKQAISKLTDTEVEFKKINSQIEVDSYDNLQKNIQQLKTASANLISFSKTQKVLSVFNGKLDKFNTFVDEKQWRTLTRMSQRILVKTNGYINPKKIAKLIKFVSSDFKTMEKITENSVLAQKDKAEIFSRISNLKTEIKMLKKYDEERKFFKTIHQDTQVSLQKWISEVSPELTLQKIQIEQIGRFYTMGLLAILVLVSSVFFCGFLYNKWAMKKNLNEIEETVENLITDGLMQQNEKAAEMFGKKFQHFSKNISDHINKRMSFGSIFQESLPLSSILLDKNLKVIWANKHFCVDWEISEDEISREYMSWDFLNKLTNLGDNDPVLEALKHGVAGIYQVKVKANESSYTKPYEMFVSPVEYNGETRIQLFFYDLTNIEQTITDQSKGILSPISTSLSQLMSGNFNSNDKLANEFEIAGISYMLETFSDISKRYEERESELMDQIELLHTRIESYSDSYQRVLLTNDEAISSNKDNVQFLKSFKHSVIGLSTTAYELDNLTTKEFELINTNMSILRESILKLEQMKETSFELIGAMPKFNKVKEDIRNVKTSLYEAKSKFAHELSQLSILMKHAQDSAAVEKLSRTLAKAMKTFEAVNTLSDELDRKVSSLELVMSKAQIVIDSSVPKIEGITSTNEMQQLSLCEKESKSIKKFKSTTTERIDSYESQIVESLQGIFKGTKDIVGNSATISNIVKTETSTSSESQSSISV